MFHLRYTLTFTYVISLSNFKFYDAMCFLKWVITSLKKSFVKVSSIITDTEAVVISFFTFINLLFIVVRSLFCISVLEYLGMLLSEQYSIYANLETAAFVTSVFLFCFSLLYHCHSFIWFFIQCVI